MTLDRWFAVGMTLWAFGGLMAVVALGVQSYRTNQHSKVAAEYSRTVDEYSRVVSEAVGRADVAEARGDFAEARRVLAAVPKPPIRPVSE